MKNEGGSTEKLNPDFILEINGKKFVRYAGLLELAESQGLKSLDVELIQVPAESNGFNSIAKATAELESGKRASDLADASPDNMNSAVSKFPVAISSLRAKARCLRNLCGVSMTALEELSSFSDVIGEESSPPEKKQPVQTESTNKSNTKPSTQSPTQPPAKPKSSSIKSASTAQLKAIRGMSARQDVDPSQLCQEMFKADIDKINVRQASQLIEHLKTKAA